MEQIHSNGLRLEPEKGKFLFYQMLLMRRFEEKSAEMYTKSKIRGFLHLYIGEEAVAAGVIDALNDDDPVLGTYREHGHALARGVDPRSIMAEMYGKVEGCSMGRGGSMHLFDVSKKFYGGNAIVGGHLPLAVGMALALKKQQKKQLVCCFFGEGAAAEGEFHEALNLAALWNVPVLFVCENNLYAMGTALRYSHSVQEIEKKGPAYNVASAAVDGMSLISVLNAAKEAVEQVRSTGKPYLLVCNTYRFRAHSMFDAELYRDKEEVEMWKKRDPIPEFQEYLLKNNLISKQEIQAIENRVKNEVQQAVAFAEAGTFEPVEDLTKFTYSQT
jgi:pyruvate dehydrogenase E1 component alpha subunit